MVIPINGIKHATTISSCMNNKICIYIVAYKCRNVNNSVKFFPDNFMQISCDRRINMIIKHILGGFYDR